jgi:hypothetical protein
MRGQYCALSFKVLAVRANENISLGHVVDSILCYLLLDLIALSKTYKRRLFRSHTGFTSYDS